MKIVEELKGVVLGIGGIVLFIWIASALESAYRESKTEEIDKKITATCDVIRRAQPNNSRLYDDCWTVGMEQFNTNN